ncbi:Periplasmic binding protein/LacI transcriptional regulator [Imhoffiella purpurea]|uniref:Periplasmic binding protein/LacI transcriptional regulator n=2 Tax=Imhoffiella purpurea TaxID=1249627 RepID=W9VSI4_9GAMM|nr:Periplasmic binding protein/LacI transcriptional regulator [Imhoffiella purpurea]
MVNAYYGEYLADTKEPGISAASLKGPILEPWRFVERARGSYTIGVLFPQLEDSYWGAVDFGIAERAVSGGVAFDLLEAGGYPNLAVQVQQLHRLRDLGVDGVILAGVAYDKLDSEVALTVAAGIPVVAVINDIRAPRIQAKSMVPFYEMGAKVGEYLREKLDVRPLKVAFFPGPRDSGWAPESLEGFVEALEGVPGIRTLTPLWGDTDERTQRSLIRRAFHFYPDIDCLVGNAVMAEVAPSVLGELGRPPGAVRILSTYLTPEVYAHIQAGRIEAAPADLNIDQGRIAMDMMIRLLDGQRPGVDFPFRAGPQIPILTTETIREYPFERLFGDRGFEPVLRYRPDVSEAEAP